MVAQFSVTPQTADKVLAKSPYSLLRQADYNPRKLQQDGWWVGYYLTGNGTASGLRVVKSPKAVYKEKTRYQRLAEKVQSRIIMAHLRAASNPLKLPKSELIGKTHTQPFHARNILFTHNGTLLSPVEVRKNLGKYSQKLKGKNDSEILFWNLYKHYRKSGDILEAFKACEKELTAINPAKSYRGLNVLWSDGRKLFAFSNYPSKSPALFNPRQRWGELTYAVSPMQLIVGSEKTAPGKKWKILKSSRALEAWIEGGKIRTRLHKL